MFFRESRYRVAFFFLFSIILTLPLNLLARGQKGKIEQGEIYFWHSVGIHNKNILTDLIDSYNNDHKQTIVRGAFQGNEEDLYLKLLSQENPPDLALIPVHYLRPLQQKAIIADLSAIIPNKLKDDIPEIYWESTVIDDRVYGVPFSFKTNLLFINQHILRISGTRRVKEPANWEEIFTVTKRIRDNTDGKWGLFIPMENLSHFISFVESFSGKPIFQNQRLIVNSIESIRAMTSLQAFVYSHEFMPAKITMSEGEQIFLSGNLGIMIAPSSQLVYTQTNLPYNLTVWNLPTAEAIKPIITGSCLVSMSNELRPQREIFKFMEYLVNFENSIKWHTHTGSPAIRSSAKDSLDLLIFYEENPNYMTPIIEIERGRIFFPTFDYFAVDKIIKNALERIMLGGEDPGEILNSAQLELDKL